MVNMPTSVKKATPLVLNHVEAPTSSKFTKNNRVETAQLFQPWWVRPRFVALSKLWKSIGSNRSQEPVPRWGDPPSKKKPSTSEIIEEFHKPVFHMFFRCLPSRAHPGIPNPGIPHESSTSAQVDGVTRAADQAKSHMQLVGIHRSCQLEKSQWALDIHMILELRLENHRMFVEDVYRCL